MRRFLPSLHTGVVLAAAVFAVFASVAVGFQGPALGGGDEPAHLDYVIDVWHGTLPVFENGLTIDPPFGVLPPVQWVAQHPPLFYWLLAPVVGPLWDDGSLYFAVLAGRAVNALFAGATVLAAAWAARRIAPRRPDVAPVAAVVVSCTSMLLLVGGAVYNDLPNVALGALALGVGATAIRRGISTPLLVGATLVTTAGMLSRLTFAVFLAAVVVSFLCARGLRPGPGPWNGVVGRVVAAVVVLAAPVAASAWFWLHNIATSGNIAGSHPEWSAQHLHRDSSTFWEVVSGSVFWRGVFGVFRGSQPPEHSGWTWALLLGPLVLGVVVLVVRRLRRNALPLPAPRRLPGTGRRSARAAATAQDTTTASPVRSETLVVLMVATVFVLLVLLQVAFVMQGGAPQTRYGLPMVPLLAVVMGFGLASWGRWISPVLLTVWTAVAAWNWYAILDLAEPPYLSAVPLQIARAAALLAVVAVLVVLVLWWLAALRRTRTPRRPTPDTDPGTLTDSPAVGPPAAAEGADRTGAAW
ncbi:hypothetical protein [Curtobacterium sp. ME26]|uniref:hypothetical protein n=1 Tax=Curtobacterium sp. ME26 TaxID=2744254 RepID=UPI0015F581ED|nr:hypothetical protein [Curtobacterium sp. ME26]